MDATELGLLLEDLQISRLKLRGTNWTGLCPFHDETKPSFGVSTEKLLYNCYSCKVAGNLVDMVSRIRKCSLQTAKEHIDKFGQYDAAFETGNLLWDISQKKAQDFSVPRALYKPYVVRRRIQKAKEYLTSRGILYRKSGTLTKTGLEIGYDPVTKRVLFPWEDSNEFYGCVGRTINNNPVRYLPFFGLVRGRHLFQGHTQARNAVRYVIVEGEIDAIKISQWGRVHGATAFALGSSRPTSAQMYMLKEFGGPYIIGMDIDDAGRNGTAYLKHNFIDARIPHETVLWPQEDPGACKKMELIRAIKQAGNFLF